MKTAPSTAGGDDGGAEEEEDNDGGGGAQEDPVRAGEGQVQARGGALRGRRGGRRLRGGGCGDGGRAGQEQEQERKGILCRAAPQRVFSESLAFARDMVGSAAVETPSVEVCVWPEWG